MSTIKDLQATLADFQTAQFVTTVLRDISATKLQSLRLAFEQNATYYDELARLLRMVERYADSVKIKTVTEKEKKMRETVYLAVTSNKRFYGVLNQDVMNHCSELLKKDVTAKAIVIGQTGLQYLELSPLADRFTGLEFEEDELTVSAERELLAKMAPYRQIKVVHPHFVNSFRQEPSVSELAYTPKETDDDEPEAQIDYLFEPEIPKLHEFFATEIRAVLLRRVMLETRLAWTGARLMKMQRARERSRSLVKEQRRLIHKEVTTMQSMRLLESFAAFRKDLLS